MHELAAMQMVMNLYPEPKEHKSCKGCCHLVPIYRYEEEREQHRLVEHVEYHCDLSPWGYSPVGSPKRCKGCPDGVPERYDSDYIRGHNVHF